MPIIIFSSDLHRKSIEIVEKTAQDLGYKCVDRNILGPVAAKYHIPEDKLKKALEEMPSFMKMPARTWKQYLAYIQEAVLGELLQDNVVCHGVAAHLYVLGVSHVLKVKLLMDTDERIRQVSDQEKSPIEKAKKIVQRIEKLRKCWSLEAFNLDETDPSLYDMVINTSQIEPEEVVSMIRAATGYKRFQPMTYSIKCMQDRELASRIKAALIPNFPDARVQSRDGAVVIEIKAVKREKQKKTSEIKELVGTIPGVHYVEVHTINDIFRQAAESGR